MIDFNKNKFWKEAELLNKNDKKIILVILTFALCGFAVKILFFMEPGNKVTVYSEKEKIASYSLSEEVDILLKSSKGGTNRLVIKDGEASVIEASCPDQLCIHQKSINKSGETIVCLPNQLVVEVIGGERSELDSIAN